jgi:hypothetical protein
MKKTLFSIWLRLAILLLAPLASLPSLAGTTSAILTGTTVVNFTTPDSACAALKTAFALTAGRVLHACSTDPVVVGTTLLFTNTATNPRTVALTTVTAQTSVAPATAYPDNQAPLFQGASTASTSAIAATAAAAAGGGAAGAITVTDAFGTATPEQYQAMALVFGAILSAAAVIWGSKALLQLLRSSNEA